MIFFAGLMVGGLLGVAFMCMLFLAKEADKHLDFAPEVPRLKNEAVITLPDQARPVKRRE